MLAQVVGDALRVGDVALHAHVQGLEALQQQEGVERALAGAIVAQHLGARLHQPAEIAEVLEEAQVVVALGRLGHPRELAVVPREAAGVDDRAAHGGAVAADELGGRMHHDVGAKVDRPAQVRAGEGVVHHQRDAVVVRDLRHRLYVEHVDLRVAERLGEDALGLRPDGMADRVVVADVHEPGVDADLAELHVELVDGAAVEGTRGDELVARVHQRDERDVLRRLAGGGRHGADAVLEGGDALLEHRHRRVHDARVDVAEALQRE